jgi:hypothetical protein
VRLVLVARPALRHCGGEPSPAGDRVPDRAKRTAAD